MSKLSIFQIVLLIVFGVLGIAGVLIFAVSKNGTSSTSVGPVTIWGDIDSSAFDAVLQNAVNLNNDFDQVEYFQKDSVTYKSELLNALANGSGPDMFLINQDDLLSNTGRIIPIPTASLSYTQFNTLFIDAARVFYGNNGAFGIPITADPLVLYWNKDTLNAAGYAKPPSNWREVQLMAEKLLKRSDTGAIVKSAIAFGEYSNVTNSKEILSALILQDGGQIVTVSSSGNLVSGLTSGNSGQATENALTYYTEFANPSNAHYSWNRSLPESQKAFAAGDLALYIGFASEGPVIAKMNPNLNFDVSALPQIENAAQVANVSRIYGISISRTAKNQLGALTVALQFASTGGTAMGKNLSTVLGIPSALRDVLALPATGVNDMYKREALISRSWYDPDPARTSEIFRSMIENITSGSLSVSGAIQRADQELSSLLSI